MGNDLTHEICYLPLETNAFHLVLQSRHQSRQGHIRISWMSVLLNLDHFG